MSNHPQNINQEHSGAEDMETIFKSWWGGELDKIPGHKADKETIKELKKLYVRNTKKKLNRTEIEEQVSSIKRKTYERKE